MPTAQYRHYGCRITDDLIYKGMRTLFLENEILRIGILLDKGADLFQFLYKPSDIDFLWRSPTGLIDPRRFTATRAASSGSFLDNYHGGWQEILPGGGPTNYQGAELGLHGEVDQLGWDYEVIEDSHERISVRLQVDCIRTPFHLERVMHLEAGKPVLTFEECLINRSPQALDFMWGHHPAFGAPFLHQGIRIFVPAGKVEALNPQFLPSSILDPGAEYTWPIAQTPQGNIDLSQIPGPEAGFGELLFLKELRSGWYALVDPKKKIGFGLAWPKEIFPYIWFWLVYGKAPNYPWWDQAYVVALEPWTSIPNNLDQAIQRGTQRTIEGGGRIKVQFSAVVITGQEEIKHIDPDGTIHPTFS